MGGINGRPLAAGRDRGCAVTQTKTLAQDAYVCTWYQTRLLDEFRVRAGRAVKLLGERGYCTEVEPWRKFEDARTLLAYRGGAATRGAYEAALERLRLGEYGQVFVEQGGAK